MNDGAATPHAADSNKSTDLIRPFAPSHRAHTKHTCTSDKPSLMLLMNAVTILEEPSKVYGF